ncbi:MAG: LamG domain-containing protein [Lentisphaerae bacterium]|nr:LamG domain-containing protein [Lentisphaerota bacterium]
MKTPMTKLMLAATAATLLCLGARAATGDLLAHLSFDDYGNGGTNVLKATVGEDGIVRTTKANVVEGLGAVAPVTDAAILAGLHEGDRAVAIPLGTHIALPIPAALSSESGKPWSISMKVKFPSLGPWYSIFTMPAANADDTMVYLTNSESPAIMLKQSGSSASGSGGFTAGQWETLLFLFDSDNTRVLLNGKQIFSKSYTLAGSRADCVNAGGFILLSGDNDSDDSLMYWADVKVYDGIVDDTTDWEHYTITWRDEDGSLIDTTNVAVGAVPTHAIPEKPTTTSAYYYFSGWAEGVVPATCDATYTATYRERQQDEDGYYLLDSSWAWDDFAELVTTDPTVNGRMTADINLGDDQTHIGSIYESGIVYFKGIFDGQGHTLTVNYVGSDGQMVAPFDKIENATIKNLHVAGTIQSKFAYLGVVGWAGGASVVSNVWMSAEIANSFGGWGHTGSIVGGISGNQSLTIVDCLFTGSLTCGTSYTGCFLGNGYNGNAEVNNCLSVGTVNIGGNSTHAGTHNNCYFKHCLVPIAYATQVSEEQLADGSIATALQAGREEEVWVQSAELGHPALKTLGSKETITWLNDDGSQIDTTEVINSYVPVHAEPLKSAATPYRWVFTGWTPELEAAVSNTTYTATFKKIADLSLVESDWTAADGDEIVGEATHEVTIPGGAHVTINGVAVAGAGGGAAVDAPEFADDGESVTTKFEKGEGDTWKITAFAEMSNESRGTDVTDSQIKVYSADTLEELKNATIPVAGATVKETKSAVKTVVEVPAPSGKDSQFFRVDFGE